MKRIALAVALLLSWGAFADEWMARNGADEVRLSDKPCTNAGILSQIGANSETFHAASGRFGGKHFEACWELEDDGNVWLRYEDGDQGILPLSVFRRVPTI